MYSLGDDLRLPDYILSDNTNKLKFQIELSEYLQF